MGLTPARPLPAAPPAPGSAARSTRGAAAVASAIASTTPGALLFVYRDLAKFKLTVFVTSTAAAGFALGSGPALDLEAMAWASLGTMLCSSSANAWNQIFEKENDARMARTLRRPLPSGRCSRPHAIAFAALAGLAGVGVLKLRANDLTANLGAFNIALYALCYTPLKRVHWSNTWVGAVVGAVPPLMGWAAASGSRIFDDDQIFAASVLPLALYFWQMPHFMALAHMARDDYVRGGYRMMTHPAYQRVESFGAPGRRAAAVALRNALALVPVGVFAVACGVADPPFAYEAALVALPVALSAAQFYRAPRMEHARRLFYGSLLYLPAFQLLAVAHRVPRPDPVVADANAIITAGEPTESTVAEHRSGHPVFANGGVPVPNGEKRASGSSDARVAPRSSWDAWLETVRSADLGRLVSWSSWSAGGWRAWDGTEALGGSMAETSHAPFPFLPPPTWPDSSGLGARECPHIVECEGGAGAGGGRRGTGRRGAREGPAEGG